MQEIFGNMEREKQDRIINAALSEFSRNKYEKASTNVIAREAGVSKGLIYHYFSKKKKLYETLESFTFATIVDQIESGLDWDQDDILTRLMQIAIVKMKLTERYPHIFDFMLYAFADKSMQEISDQRDEIAPQLLSDVYTKNIDYGKFRSDIDMQRAMKIIGWSIEKYGEEMLQTIRSMDEVDYDVIMEDFEAYLGLFRKTFYKEEKI